MKKRLPKNQTPGQWISLGGNLLARFGGRDRRWHYYVRHLDPVTGKRPKEEIGTDRQQAEDEAALRRKAIREGTFVGKEQKAAAEITFDAFADVFMEKYGDLRRSVYYSEVLIPIRKHFGDRLLREITRRDLDDFAAARFKEVGPSTVRKNLTVLGTMFKRAVQWDYLDASPAAGLDKPKEPRHKIRYLEVDEFDVLVGKADPWLGPVLRFAVGTGMRLKEITALRWRDVDRKRGRISVSEDNKTGEPREVPVNSTVRDVLADLTNGAEPHPAAPVFTDEDGNPIDSDRSRNRISQRTRAAAKAAKLEGVSFHTMRHTCASWMAQADVPTRKIQEILGHASIVTTQRYEHLRPDHLTETLTAVDERFASGPRLVQSCSDEGAANAV